MNPSATSRLGWPQALALGSEAAEVLVVDDDPEIRVALKKLVATLGHDVRVAASAEEADTWLASKRFDLVLLDIELPRMKGPEFLRWALERDPELAIIMLTGVDDPQVAISCLDAGARTYLVKPIEIDFLRLAVRDALAMRRLLLERNRARAELDEGPA